MKKNIIVFTGGGTAGHVTPNIAIMNEINKDKWEIHYIGSHTGIEKELIHRQEIPYHGISSGKLRRYIDFKNIRDPFLVMKGVWDARRTLKKLKPRAVFSKGGFVTVPVVIAARSLKIPVYLHESDLTPGLANKIAQKFATKIFTSFDEAAKHFDPSKTTAVGSPTRRELLEGNAVKGKHFLGFTTGKPILTIMGGSLGAKRINDAVREQLPALLERFQICHLCGKGHLDESLEGKFGYRQFEYIHDELPDILAATDFVLTRGGSNAIFEFLAMKKPMLIIPLSRNQSRGDQILNAKSFQEKGYALMLEEEELTNESLVAKLDELQTNRDAMIYKMENRATKNTIDILLDEILK